MTTPTKLFDLSSFDSVDEADYHVPHPVTGEPSGLIITFAGPGHPKTVALSDRLARKSLREERLKETALVNRKKWKAEDREVEDVRRENIDLIVERIVRHTPCKIDGIEMPQFEPEKFTTVLLDPKKGKLVNGISEWLYDDDRFTDRSAKT